MRTVAELRRTEEQQELAAVLGELLGRHAGPAAVRSSFDAPRGYDEKLWSMLCEQVGVGGLAIPEEYGGAGYGFAEVAVVLEELGRSLAPTPLLATTLATETLLRAGAGDACERLLPDVAGGTRTATLAWAGVTGMPEAEVSVSASEERLSGTVPHVLCGDTADVVLVVARSGSGRGVFEVASDAPGLRRTHTPTMDPGLRLARLDLDDTPATPVSPDATHVLRRVHALGAAAVAATATGVAGRGLDMTVAYSKERVQFGRPIGSFQALKHRMADLLVLVETSRSAALDAAVAVAEDVDGDGDVVRRTSVAKAWCDDALEKVAAETIQLHGGIAITWEHDAHLVFKRAHALRQLFGPAHAHRKSLL